MADYIERVISKDLQERSGKAKIILGSRQTGKTTLLRKVFGNKDKVLWFNGDEPNDNSLFENISSTRLKNLIGDNKTVIIDEAQKIDNIGLKLKLIADNIEGINLIATGSSAFELSNKVTETLTGRKREFKIFPFSFKEMVNHHGLLEEIRLIPHRLIYGYYPEVVVSKGKERGILN